MTTDREFMEKWKPIREKGIVAFLKRDVAVLFILTVVMCVIFYFRNPENIAYTIKANAFMFILFTFIRSTEWFNKEKKYKRIKALSENKEPTR